jgi:hypothetical protein
VEKVKGGAGWASTSSIPSDTPSPSLPMQALPLPDPPRSSARIVPEMLPKRPATVSRAYSDVMVSDTTDHITSVPRPSIPAPTSIPSGDTSWSLGGIDDNFIPQSTFVRAGSCPVDSSEAFMQDEESADPMQLATLQGVPGFSEIIQNMRASVGISSAWRTGSRG